MQDCCKTSDELVWLNQANKDNLELGGKAKNLASLFQLNLPVPNAFFIPPNWFDKILYETGNGEKIKSLIENLSLDNVKETSLEIKDKILNIKLPKHYISQIYKFFDNTKFSKVSVRSSAKAEDGENNAFAGMLDSFLNVDKKNLILSIKKCWASLFNERCLTYQLLKHITISTNMTVIVQEMIVSEYSGVAFSVNPTTNTNEVLIEYVEGLGEILVSGKLTPNQVKIQNKKIKYVSNEDSFLLIKNQILELYDILKLIKKAFKHEIDVEFAISKGQLYILQCRPITTLFNINSVLDRQWEFYVNRKFCYLFESFQQKAMSQSLHKKLLGFSLKINNYMILDGKEYYLDKEHERNLSIFEKLYQSDNKFFNKYVTKLFDIIKQTEEYTQSLKIKNFKTLSEKDIAIELNNFEKYYLTAIVPTFARPDDFLEGKFLKLLNNLEISSKQQQQILTSVASYPKDYPQLSYIEAIKSLKTISKMSLNNISAELDEHIKKFSWMKGPLCPKLQKFSKSEYLKDIVELKKREQTKDKHKNIEHSIELLKNNSEILNLYNNIRDFIYLRTKLSETSDYLFYTFRTSLLKEIRMRLHLSDKEIVGLGIDEIKRIFKGSNIPIDAIHGRLNCFALIKSDKTWVEYSGFDAKNFISKFNQKNKAKKVLLQNELHGQVATEGYAVGKVKIIKNINDVVKVELNDIIVSSMTTPEFTSAIEKAAGFITDEGGITCHAAIISREFNIPCIVGTKNATTVLKDGQKVELDAFHGIVKY